MNQFSELKKLYKMKYLQLSLTIALLSGLKLWSQEVLVLGIAQDAGKPQLGCTEDCCVHLSQNFEGSPVSLAILDSIQQEWYLMEASPALPFQIRKVPTYYPELPHRVFLSHAHMGHYTGLIHFGREAANSKGIICHVGSRMSNFLRHNGPWSQLVELENIKLSTIENGARLNFPHLEIEAIQVPHRDEFSETFGFILSGPKKKLLFIPDIDKWERWHLDIDSIIKTVDYALLDATFYDEKELPGRDMSEIPHPFVKESMERWDVLPREERSKIYFIHLNHSNPLWQTDSQAYQAVLREGFHVAKVGERFKL